MTDHKKTFEESSIVSLLIKLSIPATIGMVFNALYNLVDTIFVGWAVGVKGIAGLTIALPIQMIIVALGLTFGSGAASIISRRLGENRPESAARASMGAFGLSLIFSVIIMVLGEAFMDPLLRLFGASPAILPYSRGYLRIILMGTWFRSFSIVGNQVSRAEGQPRVSMISQIIGAGLNMILDPLFIFVLKMGVAGAAWATIISQFFSFLYILRFLLSGRSHLPLKIRYLKADGSLTGEILSLGMPKFIRQAGMSLMVIVMNNVLGLYGGDLGIASYGLIHRLFLFTTMPIFGVVQGYQPIAGYCYGARQKERLGEVNRVAMITASIMSLGAFLLLEVLAGLFISVFTKDQDLIAMAVPALRIASLCFGLLGLQFVGATYFLSIGKAFPAFILSLSRQFLFLIPLVILLPPFWGIRGVWFAIPLADFLAAALTITWFLLSWNRLKKPEYLY